MKYSIRIAMALMGSALIGTTLLPVIGRAVPLHYSTRDNQWYVLLARNAGDNYWSDFFTHSLPGEGRANRAAQRALKEQTNGLYDVDMRSVYWQKTRSGDYVHFVQVPFIAGGELYQQGHNGVKIDFKWVPVNDIINTTHDYVVSSGKGQSSSISRGVLAMLRAYLHNAVASYTSSGSSHNSASSSSVSSWSAYPSYNIDDIVIRGYAAANSTSWCSLPGALYFYEKNKPYYEFTNFATGYPLNINNEAWPTSEHYFQAQKFIHHPAIYQQIRKAHSARNAFDIAQQYQSLQRADWRHVSFEVMLTALRHKFNDHALLKTLLLATNNRILVENAGKNDAFWGAGATGHGENHLGRMLMHVRNELNTGIKTDYQPL